MAAPAVEPQTGAKRGGWITFPFITGSMLGMGLVHSGFVSNFTVYLIKRYNVGNIDAAQISNIVNGCINISPIAGAIISDSFFGCFPVVAISSLVSLLSMILLTLTATVESLRPSPCAPGSGPCATPLAGQLAVLYAAVTFMAIGKGGTRFNIVTMGGNQFNEAKDQDVFFNWCFIVLYASAILGATVIVYVQDSVSWGLGFGLCTIAHAVAFVVLLLGARYYRQTKPHGSPFTALARVVVAAARKRKITVTPESAKYCFGPDEGAKPSKVVPTLSLGMLPKNITSQPMLTS